ncbi:ABC transporter permease [Alkalihalophilus lindianensis]|uniref:ABC transporter permease n=1 Tax=Alkalihalophilus lindianensis TaxID=1630542 RepID=A0ABU3XE48_9BACI|nr:ABC transporter permease [Alkalihalophilus lindianensis]MDV2686113.1 ABC transporter permease [Alkalihalophilus lindianensis]
MKSVFLLQWQRFRRSPVLVLSFFVLTIIFVAVLAGFGGESQMKVSTFTDDTLSEEDRNTWINLLNESDAYEFVLMEEEEAKQSVALGDKSLALQLLEDDYRILVAAEEPSRLFIEAYVHQVYMEELQLKQIEPYVESDAFRTEVNDFMNEPVLSVMTSSLEGSTGSFEYNEQLHVLFGMTLFFAIYTVMFSLMNVAEEKRLGTWERMVISPLRKWQMYMGHLLYCFIVGYLQILLIFLLFQYAFGFDLGERLGTVLIIIGCYAFTIVAVGILLLGLVRTSQQLQAIIPIVASAMAMLGGAFWPIETVTNDILLTLSKGMPILYGLEALKGATIYDRGFLSLMEPLSILLLIGVLCMGVGMNLMERRG